MDNKRQILKDTVRDLVADFLYYDRKEDEELPSGLIEEMLSEHEVSVDEVVRWFEEELVERLP